MSENKNTNKLGMSAKTRVIVAAVAVVAVAGGVFAIWHHHHAKIEQQGKASVTGAPNIQSVPGAGNPSGRYVATQNLQNNLLAKKARQTGGSAVPTITRPSFVGNPDQFGTLAATKSGPRACPIKKVVVMYKPNPANCSVANLRQARKAGVTAEELACQGCSVQALKLSGYTAGELKNVGYTAKQLKAAGYSLGQLEEAGFNAHDLKKAGYNATQLANAGFTAGQLAAAGYKPSQLKAAGYSLAQLAAAGFSAHDLKKAGYSAKQLAKAGFTPGQLAAVGYTPAQIHAAGYTAQELAAVGTKVALKGAKVCNVATLKKQREKGASALELRKQGCGLAALKAAGFTARDLKAAGYSAKQLKAAGFSAGNLRAAGFSAAQMKSAGFSAKQLKAVGYSAGALKNAGFTAAQLKHAGFTAAALQHAGFSAKKLKDAGFSAKALKKAGFSAAKLKAVGYNAGQLAAAGFSAKALKAAGITAKQLRNAGFNAARLRQAGYSAKQLKTAGYSDGDLLRAGFTPKAAGYATVAAKPQQEHSAFNEAGVATKLNSGNNGSAMLSANSPEARMAAIVRQTEARMSAQQEEDSIQQIEGAMTMQGNRMISEWSNHQSQTMLKGMLTKTATAAAGQAGSAAMKDPNTYMKAGTIMYAVLDTSVDTDEKSPIMASIVDGPLKGSKLIGHFQRVNQRVLLSFNLLNDPHYYKSLSINAVAIDPNTARTAISGKVNNHYLLKYGTVFASAFLSGLSNAIMQSHSTTHCNILGICHNYLDKLNTTQQMTVGLGTAGNQIASDYRSKFSNMAPTVKIKGGTGIGVLIMSDVQLPPGALTASHHNGGLLARHPAT